MFHCRLVFWYLMTCNLGFETLIMRIAAPLCQCNTSNLMTPRACIALSASTICPLTATVFLCVSSSLHSKPIAAPTRAALSERPTGDFD